VCGRYVSASAPDQIAAYFDVETLGETLIDPDEKPEANYNVAPTTQVPVVHEPKAANADGGSEDDAAPGGRRLDLFRWGLVPSWAKDLKIGNKMINARSETAASKNAFRRPLRKRRCIIPADGFYEWQKVEGHKKKQPIHITRTDGDMFAFAGLYEVWRGPERDQEPLFSCTILTGEPNEKMATIHNRMPIMLAPDDWSMWLDPELEEVDELDRLFAPAPSELITLTPVSTAVNNVRSRGVELTDPLPLDEVLQPIAAEAADT